MTTPTTQREADERELAIAQEAAYPYPGECAHTSVKMRHTDQSLAFRAGWQARAAVDQNTRRAAPEASALPTNDEVYAEVRRQRGSLPGYVSTNAVNDVMAAVRLLLAAPVAAPEAPASEQQASVTPTTQLTAAIYRVVELNNRREAWHDLNFAIQNLEALTRRATPAATTASASDGAIYESVSRRANPEDHAGAMAQVDAALGCVPAPSREAAPLDELFAAIDEAQRMNHYNESSFQLGVRVARLKCLADDLRAALARAPMPARDQKIDTAFFVKEFDAAMPRTNTTGDSL